jgi:hypothetical protein
VKMLLASAFSGADNLADALERRGDALARPVRRWHPDPAAAEGEHDIFDVALKEIQAIVPQPGLDAVIVRADRPIAAAPDSYAEVLRAHREISTAISFHAAWSRATVWVAREHSIRLKLILLTSDDSPWNRTLGQSVVQLVRAIVLSSSRDALAAYAIRTSSGDGDVDAQAALIDALLREDGSHQLNGAELCAGPDWAGVCRQPAASLSLSFSGPDIPRWVWGLLHSGSH